jgi:hypothetical protein
MLCCGFEPKLELREEEVPKYSAAVAAEKLDVGSTLMRYDPLAMIPLESEKTQRCSRCLKKAVQNVEQILCGRCRCESYCSHACQSLSIILRAYMAWKPNIIRCRQGHGLGRVSL